MGRRYLSLVNSRGGIRQAQCDVSIIAAGREVANAHLQKVMGACLDKGLTIELFSTGNKSDLPEGVKFHSVSKGSGILIFTNSIFASWRARGEVIVTPDPEGAIAIFLKSFIRPSSWIADVRKDYLLAIGEKQSEKSIKRVTSVLVAKFAMFASSRANTTIVADDWISPRQAGNRIVVRNAPDSRFLPAIQIADQIPRALYVGEVSARQGLWSMLRTLEFAIDWHLDVVGNIASEDMSQLLAWKKISPASARVKFHGTLKPQDAWDLAKGAWVGLALAEKTPATQSAWPARIGDYLACGIPVITTDLPRPREVIISSRAGATVDIDSNELTAGQAAGIMNSWAEYPAKYEEVRERAVIESGNWRNSAQYELIAEAITLLK